MDRYPVPNEDSPAGVLDSRAEALLIDALIVALVCGILGYGGGTIILGSSLGGLGGLILGLQFVAPVVLFVYQILFEGYYGQTIGKRARGIVVVKDDGSRCTWVAATLRNLLRVVDILPLFYLIGIGTAYLSSKHQRVGDHAARTIVVLTDE